VKNEKYHCAKNDERGWSRFINRIDGGGREYWCFGKERKICPECCLTFSGRNRQKCPCGAELKHLDGRARVPRKSASKAKWNQFFLRFLPSKLK